MKNFWSYDLLDNDTGNVLRTDTGFSSESDAELQASMEAKCDNIKNYSIRTYQPPGD